jgi:uncharacterized protein
VKLHLTGAAGVNTFTGYGAGYVLVNQQRREKSLVVMPDRPPQDWPPRKFEDLDAAHFEMVLAHAPEIVLLGTGDRLRFPRPEITRPLIDAGIGVEVMDVQAACRTYNILVAEERKVAAALLLG